MMLKLRKLTKLLMWLILGLLCALAILGSQPGLQLLRLVGNQFVPGLQLKELNGSLWQQIEFTELSFKSNTVELQIAKGAFSLDLVCAYQEQLCLHNPLLQGVNIQLTVLPEQPEQPSAQPALAKPSSAKPSSAEQAKTNLTAFAWPFRFQLHQLQIDDLTLQTSAMDIKFARLQLTNGHNRTASIHAATEPTIKGVEVPALQLLGLTLHQLDIENKSKPNAKPTVFDPEQLRKDLLAVQLPFAILLENAQLTDFKLSHQQQLQWHSEKLTTSAEFNNQAWRLSQLQLNNVLPAFSLSSSTELLRTEQALHADWQIKFNKHQLSVAMVGPFEQLMLDAHLAFPEQTVQPLKLQGQLNLMKLQYQAELQASQLDELLAIYLPQTPNTQGQPHAAQINLRNFNVLLRGNLTELNVQSEFDLKWPELPSSQIKLQVLWDFESQQIQFEQFDVATLNGLIAANGSYEIAKQQLKLNTQLTDLMPGLFWVDYPGLLNGRFALALEQKPQFMVAVSDVDLQGELRNHPLKIAGGFALQQVKTEPVKKPAKKSKQQAETKINTAETLFDFSAIAARWHLQIPELVVVHGPNQFRAKGALEQDWQLALELNASDLSYTLPLTEGQIQANFKVTGNAKDPLVSGKLQAQQLSYLDDYALGELNIEGSLKQWGRAASLLNLTATQGQAPNLQLQKFEWRADGTLSSHQSIVLLDSNQLELATTYVGSWTGQRWQAQIDEARIKSDFGDWMLRQPLKLEFDDVEQQLSLADSCWTDGPAEMCLLPGKKLSLVAGNLSLKLTQVDLAMLDPLAPAALSFSGRVDGQANVDWQQGKLRGFFYQLSGQTGMAKLQTNTLLQLPWQTIRIEGSLAKNQLENRVNMQLTAESQLDITANLLQLDQANPQIAATVKLDPYSLKFLQPLMNEWTEFDGNAMVDLRLAGALTNPEIRGRVLFSDLVMSGKQAPLELNPSEVRFEFLGYQGLLNGLLKTPDGDLTIGGQASWREMSSWSARLDVQSALLKLHLMDADLSISPDLSFTANPLGGEIRGLIKVPQANLAFESLPENAIRVSDDEVIIVNTTNQQQKTNWKLTSDVRLQLGQQVKLAAFGLKTRLEGELRLRQTSLVPTVHGTVHLKEGSFRAYGQDLKLRKGRLIFNGQASQPMLAIEAIRNPEKTEDDVIAGLRVNGVADNPVIEVFSEPGKPQANALAYLLLGRDISSSAGDGSVTAGLIGIGIANSGKLVGKLGEAFGVSDLSLDTAGSGDQSKVTVSGYLSPKLQIKYGVGIFNQLGEFTLRYRLMKQLYVEGVTGVANSVDLLYKMEFN